MKRLCPPALGCVALLSLAALPGCSDREIVAYRIPKEKDPVVADQHAHAHAPAEASGAAVTTAVGAADGMSGPAVATAGGTNLAWAAPAHWQAKAASTMRKGSFVIAGENGASAELAITAFPGGVGGETANVNRWRGQLALAPLPDAEIPATLTRLQSGGLAIAVVDVVNASVPGAPRLLGAMVPFEGATWFFKLTGPDAIVAREKPAFLAFLQTLKPASPAATTPAATP